MNALLLTWTVTYIAYRVISPTLAVFGRFLCLIVWHGIIFITCNNILNSEGQFYSVWSRTKTFFCSRRGGRFWIAKIARLFVLMRSQQFFHFFISFLAKVPHFGVWKKNFFYSRYSCFFAFYETECHCLSKLYPKIGIVLIKMGGNELLNFLSREQPID